MCPPATAGSPKYSGHDDLSNRAVGSHTYFNSYLLQARQYFTFSAVDTMNGMPVMKSRRSQLLQDVGEVTDGDVNICVSVPANDMATIMVPILDAQNYSVTVKTLTTHDDSCLYYNDANVFVMVKAGPPFRSISRGVYRKCVVGLKYDESTLSAQFFECTCIYGPCEGVYVKIQSKCSVSVCSIEV